MYDFLPIIITGALGLSAHLSRYQHWLAWLLRSIVFIVGLLEFSLLIMSSLGEHARWTFDQSTITILTILCATTWLLLFRPFREWASWLFTSLDLFTTGQIFVPLIRKKINAKEYFADKKIFVPNSIPHLIALFIYVTANAYLLFNIKENIFKIPDQWLNLPSAFEQFFSCNGIGLLLISFCGIGLWVYRSNKQALQRLALLKPTPIQIFIGILLVFAGFYYDALWAIYTHHLAGQDLATELSYYNAATFTIAGAFVPSVIAAMLIAICAGIGEETLFRGALQPVFGIIPAALLHGLLHAYIAHTPIFIVKVALWSIFIGVVKRYTNTTTTIIGHAGFNLVTIFLFSLNP